MASVFISYSSKSKDQVSALAEDLEMAGHQIWFDHKLTGGQAWWDQILENIRQSDLFVFALTPEALDSYPCKLEYTYASSLNKHVLPVLLSDGVSVNLLPPELTTIQFVDYRGDDKQAAFKLMNALNGLPAPEAMPDPLPASPPVPISYIGNLKDQIDSTNPMSFEEQASLVFKLKEHLDNQDEVADVITLLKRLRRRDDLYARMGEEIDELLAKAEGRPAAAAAPVPTTPPPPRQEPVAAQSATLIHNQAAMPNRVNVVKPSSPASGEDAPWNAGILIALGVGTLIIPLIGIVAGVIGLRSEAKRNQGIGLLIFGIVMALMWMSSINEMFYYF